MALTYTGVEAKPEIRTDAVAKRAPAFVTVALGIVLVFSVGFVHATVVHNGAHDARHANGFPCH